MHLSSHFPSFRSALHVAAPWPPAAPTSVARYQDQNNLAILTTAVSLFTQRTQFRVAFVLLCRCQRLVLCHMSLAMLYSQTRPDFVRMIV